MNMFTGGGKKRMRHRHTDDAENFKHRQLRAKRRNSIIVKTLFYTLCVIALITIAVVYYVYTA